MVKKKILSIILTSSILLTSNIIIPTTAYATPENTNQVMQLINQQEDLETSIQKSDTNIENLINQSKVLEDKIKECDASIESNEQLLTKTQQELELKELNMAKRLKAMYMNDNFVAFSYLDIILSSTSISDLIDRVETVKRIINYDKNEIDEVKTKKKLIEDTKQTLIKEKTENEKAKVELSKQSEVIKTTKTQQEAQLAQLKTQVNSLISTQDIQFNKEMMDKLSKLGISSGVGQNAVSYASTFLGTPYLWGGEAPGGFDCSGLMQYVYNHLGISLPRVAEDQQRVGIEVSPELAQPGDLVFFGLPAHHVGMYVGDGVMLHAPHTGDIVKFSKIDMSKVSNIKRVVIK